jgi:starch synthase
VIRLSGIEVKVGEHMESMRIKVASIPNAKLQVYFLDNDKYFGRKALFMERDSGEHYDDNDERLVFYNKGVLETVIELGWRPDIIHCHDWPSGLIPFLVKNQYKDESLFEHTQIIYNIHHTENHGIFDEKILDLLDMPESVDRSELADDHKVDLRKLGLQFSDYVVTGNRLNHQLDEEFEAMDIKPERIQGSPEKVSDKFARYYNEISSENEE